MSERITGYCPMGCGQTLFIGAGGYITCSYITCPNPAAVSDILGDSETDHIVELYDETFALQHPLRERLDGLLFKCGLHGELRAASGPPAVPGRYRVCLNESGQHHWVRLSETTGDPS